MACYENYNSDNHNNWQMNMRTLNDSCKYLFNTKTMSDITFTFNDEEKQIYAHSFILSMMSPIFYESFKSTFEVNKEIPVTDKSYEVFLEFLRFVYTNYCNITLENVFDIMELARKYLLKFLEEDCEKFIFNSLTPETACSILSKSVENISLMNRVLMFIGSRMSLIMQTDSFLNIDNEVLRIVLSIEETDSITEMEIFSNVMKWATQKCILNQMEPTARNKRFYLDDLVKLIRFPTMTSEEFALCIKQENDLLTSDEKLSLLICTATREMNNEGFVSTYRNTFSHLNEIRGKFIKIYNEDQEWDDISYKLSLNGISKFKTNQNIYITEISIGRPYRTQNVRIQILNENNTILNEELFEIKWDQKLISKRLILTKPSLIYLNQEYKINIDYYYYTNCKYRCVDEKSLPWSIMKDDVHFEFTELSPLLMKIIFKQVD